MRRDCLTRAERVRELSARLYQLAEQMTLPSRSHNRAESLIHEGEQIANDLRKVFR